VSLADHTGTPDVCLACLPLPDDFGRRQEVIWTHALAQFVDQSGVDVAGMSRADLVPLVKSWGRANSVALLERGLRDEFPEPDAEPRFDPRSARTARLLMLAVFVCLSIICTGVWRFFS
jgi:hypothetical protein